MTASESEPGEEPTGHAGDTIPPISGCVLCQIERTAMFRRAASIGMVITCAAGIFAPESAALAQQRIDRNDLCVTNGTVSTLPSGQLAIETPSSRAVVRSSLGPDAGRFAEIRFRYVGPTRIGKPLASGELRRQVGLKLRAADTCNLIYIMWHIEPDTAVAVSVKRNVGMHSHEQCGAGGYVNIKAQRATALPKIRPGEKHDLRAELHGDDLKVAADGKTVWRGVLGAETLALEGPSGFRTDNSHIEFDFYADGSTRSGKVQRPVPGRCLIVEGD